jgi:hypothetical protein
MRLLRIVAAVLMLALFVARPSAARADSLDDIARDYVHLILEIGERDNGYVDAYYGPARWRRAAHAHPRTLDQLAAATEALQQRVGRIAARETNIDARRKAFLAVQLGAAALRLRVLRGGALTFAEEARGMYGVDLQLQPLSVYDPVLARIERLVPGEGSLADRVDAFQDRFVIPSDRLEAVMRAAIEREVLYPLAGLSSADADAYATLQGALRQLSGARFTIASDLIDGRITHDEAIALTQRYGLVSRPRAEQAVAFNEHYRAYVINYGLGQAMVRAAIEATGSTPATRWAAMWWILSGPTIPADLGVPAR